jgi:hypothetical protein
MVFKTTSNQISVISRWSVLLVEETGVPENQRPASGLESMIYRTGGKQVNHYTTDVVPLYYQLT